LHVVPVSSLPLALGLGVSLPQEVLLVLELLCAVKVSVLGTARDKPVAAKQWLCLVATVDEQRGHSDLKGSLAVAQVEERRVACFFPFGLQAARNTGKVGETRVKGALEW